MKNRKLWVSILAAALAVIMILGLFVGAIPNLLTAASFLG